MENEVKEPVLKYNYISPEDYLAMERIASEKHEYYQGQVSAMSGPSWYHNLIAKNINTRVLPFLQGKSCNMFGSDLRIHIPENGLYTYPDFSIICGEPETTDNERDTVLRPSVIMEILSKSTKDYDRGTKFNLYRSISTLKEYILIDSTMILVEHFARQPDDSWVLTEFRQLADSFVIPPIGISLSLKNIYEELAITNEARGPVPKYNYMSEEEYLEMERAADEKHEYFEGEVFLMSGASLPHSHIAANVNRLVASFAYGKGCKLFGSDFRVHIPDNTLYTYPDFSIVCGDYKSAIAYTDNLTAPSVLIEILSKSTRDYDRGSKFMLYRSIKSLREYILIDSTMISVELFSKQTDNSWRLTEFRQLSDSFVIGTIGLTLLLKDLYEDLSFAE